MAAFAVADAVRPESRDAIQRLHEQRIEVVMLTGDAKAVATAEATDLGIDTVFAEVLPADKVEKIKELKVQGKRVAMVGDGVNELPPCSPRTSPSQSAQARTSPLKPAMWSLVRSDPRDVPRIIALSRASGAGHPASSRICGRADVREHRDRCHQRTTVATCPALVGARAGQPAPLLSDIHARAAV